MSVEEKKLQQVIAHGKATLLSFQETDGSFCSEIRSSPTIECIRQKLDEAHSHTPVEAVKRVLAFLGFDRRLPGFDDHHQFYTTLAGVNPRSSVAEISKWVVGAALEYNDPILWEISLYLAKRYGAVKHQASPKFSLRVWDTIFAIDTCRTLGETEVVQKAIKWLTENQRLDGSWSCSAEYPLSDADTTASAVLALARDKTNPSVAESLQRALSWLENQGMEDGSYKTFRNDKGLPCAEVTANVALALQESGRFVGETTLSYLRTTVQGPPRLYGDLGRHSSLLRRLKIDHPHPTCSTLEGVVFGSRDGIELEHILATQNENGTWKPSYYIRYLGNVFLSDSCWTQAVVLKQLAVYSLSTHWLNTSP